MKLWEYYSSGLLVFRRSFNKYVLGGWGFVYDEGDMKSSFYIFENACFNSDFESLLKNHPRKDYSWYYMSRSILNFSFNVKVS
jgi:hypothetical protein